jgi:hypothetical protein
MWTLLGILTQIYPWMKMHLLPQNRRNRSQTRAKTNAPKGQVLPLAFLLNIFSLHILDPQAVDADGFLADIQVYNIKINKRLCDDQTCDLKAFFEAPTSAGRHPDGSVKVIRMCKKRP